VIVGTRKQGLACACGNRKLRVVDVRYLPKKNVVHRARRCPTCSKVVLTEERVINADRANARVR